MSTLKNVSVFFWEKKKRNFTYQTICSNFIVWYINTTFIYKTTKNTRPNAKSLSSLDTNKRPRNIWVDIRTNFFSFMKNFMLEFCAFTIFEKHFCIHSANLKAKVFYQKTSDTRFTFKVNNICTNYKLSVASKFESVRHVKSESSKRSIFL